MTGVRPALPRIPLPPVPPDGNTPLSAETSLSDAASSAAFMRLSCPQQVVTSDAPDGVRSTRPQGEGTASGPRDAGHPSRLHTSPPLSGVGPSPSHPSQSGRSRDETVQGGVMPAPAGDWQRSGAGLAIQAGERIGSTAGAGASGREFGGAGIREIWTPWGLGHGFRAEKEP